MISTVNLPFFFLYNLYSDSRSKLPIAGFTGSSDEEADTSQFQCSQIHLPAFRQVLQFWIHYILITRFNFALNFVLTRVTENCKANSMDSKNLAICWWPTLLPFEFTDMIRFEMMRPHLEDTVQAMIDQFPFLFLGKDEIVMV